MKKIEQTSLVFVVTILLLSLSFRSEAGCVICDMGNEEYCQGNNVKACVDEGSWWDTKCKGGISSTSECPSIGG